MLREFISVIPQSKQADTLGENVTYTMKSDDDSHREQPSHYTCELNYYMRRFKFKKLLVTF
jgi:hypothetical protein